ncbi:hypothetical protein HDV00_000850 [Rhizophlyctis rosea]|nr:hypothetical protein HDV00_000850 [Rhizophlyctis rosea]
MPPKFYLRCPSTLFQDKHADDLIKILDQDDSTDVRLIVGDKKVVMKVHSALLSASSDFFKTMFSTSQWIENATGTVELPSLLPDAVKGVVCWMYTGHICGTCFLYTKRPQTPPLTYLHSALQTLQTLHYFLIFPLPPLTTPFETICLHIKQQSHPTQLESWRMIQRTHHEEMTLAAIPHLAYTNDFKQFIALVKATDEVRHMVRVLEVAGTRKQKLGGTSTDVFLLIRCLAEWVEGKREEEDIEELKAMLFGLVNQLG